MKRKIILCGLFRYPRGGATANYIQYLADALILADYDVVILSYVNPEFTDKIQFEYRNAKVIDLEYHSEFNILNRLMNGKLFTTRMVKILKSLNLTTNDMVVVSTMKPISDAVFKAKNEFSFKTCGYPLEWFPREHFHDKKTAELRELEFQKNRRHDLIWPISHFIANELGSENSKLLVLPIMADIKEYKYKEKVFSGTYNFILPANGAMKDALEEMLLAVSELDPRYIKRMQFHLTGIKENRIISIIGIDGWNRIRNHVVVHDWMKYDELVQLYCECHYLLLARHTNQMTLANFPSKVPEVMTYGVVPIASRVGDYTKYYLCDQVNSIIMDGADVSVCKAALQEAIDMPYQEYLVLSDNARKCIEEKLDYHVWVQAIKESIESVYK